MTSILTINAGSSSLKFSIYEASNVNNRSSVPILVGSFDCLGNIKTVLRYKYKGIKEVKEYLLDRNAGNDGKHFMDISLTQLHELLITLIDIPAIIAIAHRIVHGGTEFIEPVITTSDVLEKLTSLSSLAPLHQLPSISIVHFFAKHYKIPQILCFDTSFHQTMSSNEKMIPLPREITDQGIIRRYGFHGISYQYVISELQECSVAKAKGKVLMCHIGQGASLCACLNGKSIATTMGFSACDGLMMGTRAGTVDTGVVLYLLNQMGYTQQQISDMLYKQSGLLGVSGISSDMRILKASESASAKEAIDLFTYTCIRQIGMMISVLEGIPDIISFSGGLAEHDSLFRSNICNKLQWLGLDINEELNNNISNETLKISNPGSQVEVWIIPTNEEIMIAREALKLV